MSYYTDWRDKQVAQITKKVNAVISKSPVETVPAPLTIIPQNASKFVGMGAVILVIAAFVILKFFKKV